MKVFLDDVIAELLRRPSNTSAAATKDDDLVTDVNAAKLLKRLIKPSA